MAYSSLLKLGLARYQPNAIESLRLSHPLERDPFMVQSGWDVDVSRTKSLINVTVLGAEYRKRAPAVIDLPDGAGTLVLERLDATAHSPNLQIELLHRDTGLPVVADGQPVGRTLTEPSGPEAGRTRWNTTLAVPPAFAGRDFRVLVTEVLTHANADAANNKSSAGPLVAIPTPFCADLAV
jgi:hypothetical protein